MGGLYLFILCFMFWKFVLPFLVIIWKYTALKMLFSKRKMLKHAGKWAIVTGASDGIGKAFAQVLAKESLNLMLISRNLKQLDIVAEEIRSKYNVETRIISADFTKDDIYENIELEISKLPSIACLVNNVGTSYEYFSSYADSEFINKDFIRRLITCNTLSTCTMTRIVLPKMLNQSTGRGAIINLGSASGQMISPYLSLYAASKSMIKVFTENLSIELKGKIIVQCLHPLFVHTAMTKTKHSSLSIPDPVVYVEGALDMLGVETSSHGYLIHALLCKFMTILPSYFIIRFCEKMKYLAYKKLKKN